jgi:hypothetical protein
MNKNRRAEGPTERPHWQHGHWWATPLARLAMVLGLLVHALGFFIFDVKQSAPHNAPSAPSPLRYLSQEDSAMQALTEQSLFFDALPLFFPTHLSGRQQNPVPIPDLPRLFPESPPALTLSADTMRWNRSAPRPVLPAETLPLMTTKDWQLITFPQPEGKDPGPAPENTAPPLYVTVYHASGNLLKVHELRPDPEMTLPPLWAELRGRVLKTNSGVHQPALWTSLSSSAELNVAAEGWLDLETVLANLPPDIYEIALSY